MNIEKPPGSFTSPFELSLMALCIAAIALVILAIALMLTDTGVVNW